MRKYNERLVSHNKLCDGLKKCGLDRYMCTRLAGVITGRHGDIVNLHLQRRFGLTRSENRLWQLAGTYGRLG